MEKNTEVKKYDLNKYKSLYREFLQSSDYDTDELQYYRMLLMLYYRIHTSGAYDKWKKNYDDCNTPKDYPNWEYICDWNYELFLKYKELEKELNDYLPVDKYEDKYTDYIKKNIIEK